MERPPTLPRLFPMAAPGHNEDNGALLDLVIRALPADRLHTAAAAARGLACATIGVAPNECGRPIASYRDALETGHVPALSWYWASPDGPSLMKKRFTETPGIPHGGTDVSTILAARGHIEALQLALSLGCRWHGNTCAHAAVNGQMALLQWAHTRDPPCPWDRGTCHGAAMRGDLAILQWARAQGCPWDAFTCECASRAGHLEVLQWARENGCPWTSNACTQAAKNGHLNTLRWARTHGCPWDQNTCSYAALGGHFEVLQWARAQDPPCPWSRWTTAYAAMYGHLEFLQWARAQEPPCPWDEFACTEAAKGGHLEVLQWARAQDPPCQWGADTGVNCAQRGHVLVMSWLASADSGYPYPWVANMVATARLAAHDPVVAQWLWLHNR